MHVRFCDNSFYSKISSDKHEMRSDRLIVVKVLSHRERASDAAMRLTEKLEHYIFQLCIHTARATQQCERIIEMYSVLIFP